MCTAHPHVHASSNVVLPRVTGNTAPVYKLAIMWCRGFRGHPQTGKDSAAISLRCGIQQHRHLQMNDIVQLAIPCGDQTLAVRAVLRSARFSFTIHFALRHH